MTDRRSRHATEVPSSGRRAVVLVVAVLFAVHTVLVQIWVMPDNPIRDAIGSQRVERYIENPLLPFEQNWSVFAPTPRRAGENIHVRAYLAGSGVTTDWVDITADEDERIRHLVAPARVHSVTRRLGGDLNEQFAELDDNQLDLVTSDHPSLGAVAGRLTDEYVNAETMLTRFGTMYAIARWGDGVTMVQFRVGHRRVPDFDRRHQAKFEEVAFTYRTIGWRTAVRGDAAAQTAFDDYVARAPVEVGSQ